MDGMAWKRHRVIGCGSREMDAWGRALILLGWLAVMMFSMAWAEEPLPALGAAYEITVVETDRGMESSAVASLAYSRADGRIWFCTFNGLGTFDGFDVEDRSPQLGSPVGGQGLRRVVADARGRVWVGGEGRLWIREGDRWRSYGTGDGLVDQMICEIAFGADGGAQDAGDVWVVTEGHIQRRVGERFEKVDAPAALAAGEVYRVLYEGGRLWAMSPAGLWWRGGAGWVMVMLAEKEGVGWLTGIAPAVGGGLWVASEKDVRLLRNGNWERKWQRPEAMRGDPVRMLEDRHGNLWLGGWQNGLAMFAPDGRVRWLRREQGLPGESISDIAEDEEGNIWLAVNGGGLVRARPQSFRLFGLESGIRHLVNQVVEEAPGRLLLGTHGEGLLTMEDGRARPDTYFRAKGDLVQPWVSALHVDRAGRCWAGWMAHGMGSRDGDAWHKVPNEDIGSTRAMTFHEDRKGRLWVGTVGGVAVGERGVFHPLGPETRAPADVVFSIVEDKAAHLWLSTYHLGLFRMKDGVFEPFKIPGAPTNRFFGRLYADRDGDLWVPMVDGIARVHDGKVSTFRQAEGLIGGHFSSVLGDDTGHLWARGRNAVARFSVESAVAVAEGRRARLDVRYFDARDGLLAELGLGHWREPMKASDGRLWFPTLRGLVVVDPAHLPPALPPPRVEVRSVWDGEGMEEAWAKGRPIEMAYAGQALEVRYHARVMGVPDRVRFQNRLLPDGRWHDVGVLRSAVLRDLRPASYRLEVRATVNGFEWGEPAGLAFVVRPPWWQTWWFASGTTLGLVGMVFLGVRRVLRARYAARMRAMEQAAALDRERARIATDLHDDLGATMTQISLALERASNRGEGAASDDVRDGLEATRRGMAALGTAVWAINPACDSVSDLASHVADHASRFLRRAGLDFEIELPEPLPDRRLAPGVRHHLGMMLREALNNVARHAHATRVRVAMTADADGLCLRVEDNGRGFDIPQARPGGQGLQNLRRRASDAGMNLAIQSTADTGTRVTITLPWNPKP